jgi:hypothetical protein
MKLFVAKTEYYPFYVFQHTAACSDGEIELTPEEHARCIRARQELVSCQRMITDKIWLQAIKRKD